VVVGAGGAALVAVVVGADVVGGKVVGGAVVVVATVAYVTSVCGTEFTLRGLVAT